MARRRKGRAIDGVLLLDKPGGISSNHALQRVKRLYGAAKAGHTGALDPLATGMLPICLGEATKFSQFLLDADKRYRTTAKLGIRTDSSDADGEVVETRPVGDYSREQILRLLEQHFSGEIEQVPSMFSALKHKGQPLYKLARRGEKVEVKPRRVTIHHIELLDYRPEQAELDLEVYCSKGTYIRSIVEDLGLLLGCGAHVSMLRRLDSGPYKADMMLSLEAIEEIATVSETDTAADDEKQRDLKALDALLLAPWTAVADLPRVIVDAEQAVRLGHGQKIRCGAATADPVLIFSEPDNGATEGRFLGLGQVSDNGVLIPRRLIQSS
ncbi:tRNA pseudouridine(55) synthase TruB [Motiliproteus coralliicola]|uniref:tRNA pseudouridine synthase B n=1 Tax=Motiliproteus coralliicola TaxID=2283196 RepID=A0A369W9W7_9GAMM|nr:tRNA pseudouridine(55) synthase TruB [Motiliproteus coralliicola]RDE18103.1 tRNA pseudouridine(55) synthase TruB [Motiliproteus coralliicola]